VIPFHEYGVDLDFFYEERTCDVFSPRPLVGIRDKRACPSMIEVVSGQINAVVNTQFCLGEK